MWYAYYTTATMSRALLTQRSVIVRCNAFNNNYYNTSQNNNNIFYIMHYSHELRFGRSEIKIFSAVRHTCQTYGRWWVGSVYGNPGPDVVTPHNKKWRYNTF